jgi:hypothetical protein
MHTMIKTASVGRLARTRLAGTKLRDSLFGLLQRSSDSQGDMDGIRRAMLSALGDGTGTDEDQLVRQILFASDIEALWYARSSLMQVIATTRGETHARQSLAKVTRLFPASNPMFRQHRSGTRHH